MDNGILPNLDRLIKERQKEIVAQRRDGKKVVGYLCCKTPVEIIHALGMLPLRLGQASEITMSRGKEIIHQFTCPFIKCVVGDMMDEKSFVHQNVDIFAGSVSCLAVHRCLEVLRVYLNKPTYYLTFPVNPPKDREVQFFTAEVKYFLKQLEEVAGKKLSSKMLKDSIELFDKIRKRIKEIYEIQSLDNSPISWSEVLKLIQAGFILDPYKYLKLLEELLVQLRPLVGKNEKNNKKPRLLITGSPILPGDDLLIETIEESGAKIVADNLCTGLRTFEGFTVQEPTIENIALAYLNSIPCATAQDLELEKDRRLNNLMKLIKDYNVEGVIYYSLRFCDHYAFKENETREILAKRVNVPLLAIHFEYGETESGRLRTRVEGFIETLNERRRK